MAARGRRPARPLPACRGHDAACATLLRRRGRSRLGAVRCSASALGPFDNLQLAPMALLLLATAGLTVLTGLNGQISLGPRRVDGDRRLHDRAAARTSGQLPARRARCSPRRWSTALAGALVGVAAARLRGPYLAGATLALAVGLPALADTLPDAFLGGENGLHGRRRRRRRCRSATTFPLERWQAWIACAAALVTYVLLANLVRSRFGRTLRAVRDDEVAAAAGRPARRPACRSLAFVVSAACAGLGRRAVRVVTSAGGARRVPPRRCRSRC